MSNQTKHKVTWFQRDERGHWQWQGFRDELDTEDKVQGWVDEMRRQELEAETEGAPWQEVFIIDLENANEILAGLMADSQELGLLQGWLEDVVQIDKITVETEFNEYCEQQANASAGEDEEDDPGVDTSEEHVREGK